MPIRYWTPIALLALLLCTLHATAAQPPHILYITADDLGWKDVGFHGGAVQTPTLDRLAQAGARLEQFYVQPFSSQTRAAAMTGRYPLRYGLQTMQIQSTSRFGLPTDERLLSKALKEAGYTTALVGRWHLGHAAKDQRPSARGFDYFYGSLRGELDTFKKTARGGEPDWWRNDKPVHEPGYAITLLGRDAARVIAKHDPHTPLFLWLSLPAPMAPLQAPSYLLDRYRDVSDAQLRTYRAMVSGIDAAVSDAVGALEQRGMLKDTLIVFHANSGGAVAHKYAIGDGEVAHASADNGPYRDGRASLYEGSMRVAAFAVWPGHIEPGVVAELMHAVDLYPTILGVAGAKLEQPKQIDGVDQWPAIAQGKAGARKEVPLDVEDFRGAIRQGDWKLVRTATMPSRVELFNLRADPSEEDNQAEREPERVQAMSKRLTEFAWEMRPSLYLDELTRAHKEDVPMFWNDNPIRP